MNEVHILGVRIHAVTFREAVLQILSMLEGGKHHIMTPNSEMLVHASRDATFRSLLNVTDMNIPDSAGLLWAAKITQQLLPERVAGVDVVEQLLRSVSGTHTVFLLGGRNGVGEKAAQKMKLLNPQLKYEAYEGSPSADTAPDIIKRINESGAHLLLVAFGAPAQDIWINQHLMQLTSVRVAMGVGGTFDFLAGSISRAPKWMQRAGFEWLWRLVRQPSRIGRIVTATVVFPLLVLQSRFRG